MFNTEKKIIIGSIL